MNTALPLTVTVERGTFQNNQPIIDALFKVGTNSKLYVDESLFEDNFSLSRGSIFFGDFRGTFTSVRSSTFRRNYAFTGGVFFLHFWSHIEFDNCTFLQNSAVRGGIGRVENQASFTVTASKIWGNRAIQSTIVSIVDAMDFASRMEDVLTDSNEQISLTELLEGKDPRYQVQAPDILAKTHCLDISKGKISIAKSYITRETSFLGGYASETRITDTVIANITIDQNDDSFFTLTSSTLFLQNLSLSAVTYSLPSLSTSQFLAKLNQESAMYISNSTLSRLNVSLLQVVNSKLEIAGSVVEHMLVEKEDYDCMHIDSSSVLITNSTFRNLQFNSAYVFYVSRSENITVSADSLFHSFSPDLFHLYSFSGLYLSATTITHGRGRAVQSVDSRIVLGNGVMVTDVGVSG